MFSKSSTCMTKTSLSETGNRLSLSAVDAEKERTKCAKIDASVVAYEDSNEETEEMSVKVDPLNDVIFNKNDALLELPGSFGRNGEFRALVESTPASARPRLKSDFAASLLRDIRKRFPSVRFVTTRPSLIGGGYDLLEEEDQILLKVERFLRRGNKSAAPTPVRKFCGEGTRIRRDGENLCTMRGGESIWPRSSPGRALAKAQTTASAGISPRMAATGIDADVQASASPRRMASTSVDSENLASVVKRTRRLSPEPFMKETDVILLSCDAGADADADAVGCFENQRRCRANVAYDNSLEHYVKLFALLNQEQVAVMEEDIVLLIYNRLTKLISCLPRFFVVERVTDDACASSRMRLLDQKETVARIATDFKNGIRNVKTDSNDKWESTESITLPISSSLREAAPVPMPGLNPPRGMSKEVDATLRTALAVALYQRRKAGIGGGPTTQGGGGRSLSCVVREALGRTEERASALGEGTQADVSGEISEGNTQAGCLPPLVWPEISVGGSGSMNQSLTSGDNGIRPRRQEGEDHVDLHLLYMMRAAVNGVIQRLHVTQKIKGKPPVLYDPSRILCDADNHGDTNMVSAPKGTGEICRYIGSQFCSIISNGEKIQKSNAGDGNKDIEGNFEDKGDGEGNDNAPNNDADEPVSDRLVSLMMEGLIMPLIPKRRYTTLKDCHEAQMAKSNSSHQNSVNVESSYYTTALDNCKDAKVTERKVYPKDTDNRDDGSYTTLVHAVCEIFHRLTLYDCFYVEEITQLIYRQLRREYYGDYGENGKDYDACGSDFDSCRVTRQCNIRVANFVVLLEAILALRLAQSTAAMAADKNYPGREVTSWQSTAGDMLREMRNELDDLVVPIPLDSLAQFVTCKGDLGVKKDGGLKSGLGVGGMLMLRLELCELMKKLSCQIHT